MGLTPAERELLFVKNSPNMFKPGEDIDLDWWNAYLAISNTVDAERKAGGLLPWPHPPIPKPARTGNAMTMLLKKYDDPDFLQLPIIDQDAWFAAMCSLDAVLSLLRSPDFDALPGREQIAALFGHWPETQ
jgi:hypothetical protein